MLKEFKDFAMKGNLIDMAVAFVMGGAFGKVVTSFVEGMVAPLVGLLTGGVDLKALKVVLKEEMKDAAGKVTAPEVAISYGTFLSATIDFIVVAFVMFMIIKAMNSAKKKQEETAAPPAPPAQEVLLTEIRDLLKSR